MRELRTCKRREISLPVIYAFPGGQKIITNAGTTFDLSDSGMSFYTTMPLNEGLRLQVHLSNIWDFPRTSIVKWCSRKKNDFFKIGVFFQ